MLHDVHIGPSQIHKRVGYKVLNPSWGRGPYHMACAFRWSKTRELHQATPYAAYKDEPFQYHPALVRTGLSVLCSAGVHDTINTCMPRHTTSQDTKAKQRHKCTGQAVAERYLLYDAYSRRLTPVRLVFESRFPSASWERCRTHLVFQHP
jgi:hypothetical protein